MDGTTQTGQVSISTKADSAFASFVRLELSKEISAKIKGKFFLITYTRDHNREEEFVEFMLNHLEFYALTEEERKRLEFSRPRMKAAYRRFVQNSNTGEFGEMILYYILEIYENAPQIVNKMALKTSGKMAYHGADGVHFGLNGELKTLFLGESKTTEFDFTNAFYKAMASIKEFYREGKDKFEVNLISGNITKEISAELRQTIEDYLDPTKPNKTDCCQAHAIFLGFEESFLKELERTYAGQDLLKQITKKYMEKIEGYIKTLEQNVKKSENADKTFYFFLLPFKDLNKARETFRKEVSSA